MGEVISDFRSQISDRRFNPTTASYLRSEIRNLRSIYRVLPFWSNKEGRLAVTKMKNVYLAGAVRTPIGKFGGSLAGLSAADLGVVVA